MKSTLDDWEDLIREFRCLGGIADNVRVGSGPRGRGLFAIDPAKECRIVVPAHLLIDVADVEIRNDRLVIKNGAAVDGAAAGFFERFQAQFAFGAGSFDQYNRILEARLSLPEVIQTHLQAGDSVSIPFVSLTQAHKLHYFLKTRAIEEKKLMPVLELVNHSSEHASFRKAENGGFMIRGHFADEILASYTRADTWRIFALFGFVCTTPLALAHPGARQVGQITLGIGIDLKKTQKVEGENAPLVARNGHVLVFSYLELGNRRDPDRPRRVFNRLMDSCGISNSNSLFDQIVNTDREWFNELLRLLIGHEGEFISELRKAVQIQIDTLSSNIPA